jgi:hypothetical protein
MPKRIWMSSANFKNVRTASKGRRTKLFVRRREAQNRRLRRSGPSKERIRPNQILTADAPKSFLSACLDVFYVDLWTSGPGLIVKVSQGPTQRRSATRKRPRGLAQIERK